MQYCVQIDIADVKWFNTKLQALQYVAQLKQGGLKPYTRGSLIGTYQVFDSKGVRLM
jgi:hypothetical protein